jgi:hypothetical protein
MTQSLDGLVMGWCVCHTPVWGASLFLWRLIYNPGEGVASFVGLVCSTNSWAWFFFFKFLNFYVNNMRGFHYHNSIHAFSLQRTSLYSHSPLPFPLFQCSVGCIMQSSYVNIQHTSFLFTPQYPLLPLLLIPQAAPNIHWCLSIIIILSLGSTNGLKLGLLCSAWWSPVVGHLGWFHSLAILTRGCSKHGYVDISPFSDMGLIDPCVYRW